MHCAVGTGNCETTAYMQFIYADDIYACPMLLDDIVATVDSATGPCGHPDKRTLSYLCTCLKSQQLILF